MGKRQITLGNYSTGATLTIQEVGDRASELVVTIEIPAIDPPAGDPPDPTKTGVDTNKEIYLSGLSSVEFTEKSGTKNVILTWTAAFKSKKPGTASQSMTLIR